MEPPLLISLLTKVDSFYYAPDAKVNENVRALTG